MKHTKIIERLEAIRREAKSKILARTATLVYRRGIDSLIVDLKAQPEPKVLGVVDGREYGYNAIVTITEPDETESDSA